VTPLPIRHARWIPRWASDRGSGTIEYLALGVIAALIIGGLVAIGAPGEFGKGADTTICKTVDHKNCAVDSSKNSPRKRTDPARTDADGVPKDSGCHGLWGCALSAGGHYFGGLIGSLADAGRGIGAVFTTNPWTTLQGLGKEIWGTTGGAQYTAWKQCRSGGDRAACDEANRCVTENMALPGGCLIVDGVIDDTVKDDFSNGRYAQMSGRAVMNTVLLFVPAKVPGLGRLGKVLKGARAAEDGERASRVPKSRSESVEQARKRQRSVIGQRWSEFDALNDRGKTAFLDRLTPAQIYRQYLVGMPLAEASDVLAHLSAEQANDLYRAFPNDDNFRTFVLAHVSPKALEKINPNPKGNRFVRWRKIDTKVFDGAPKVADVTQGKYATCWCLASMQAIARQSPEMIENMIKENPNGTFTVTFGGGRKVTVTPDLPADSARMRTVAWPAILEKAFAQMDGGYEYINTGKARLALTDMTGNQAAKYQAVKPSMRDIAARFRNGYAYTVTFPAARMLHGIPNLRGRGIAGRHAYAVVAVDESARTVTLANPWGASAKPVTLTERELGNAGITLSEAPTR
jgi:hypothetical protein